MFETVVNYKKFLLTNKTYKNIVFYSEGEDYDHFYKPYFDSCLKNKIKFCYVSSSKNIPFKNNEYSKFFYIGSSFVRTLFFFSLECKNLITTMPDLENFFLKKSNACSNYIYFFHSMFSMNIIYNQKAFSHYDTIICANKIHASEVKDYEFSNLKVKFLNLGYPKIDEINKSSNNQIKSNLINSILIAPSWGNENENFKTYEKLILELLELGFLVNFRPHPMSLKYYKKVLDKMYLNLNKYKNFSFSHDKNNLNDYLKNDLIISDWSGSAIEFALATKKRCIFLETKQKIRNKNFRDSENFKSLEIIFKTEFAESFNLKNLKIILKKINCHEYLQQYEKKIDIFREKYLFNFLQTETEIDKFIYKISNE